MSTELALLSHKLPVLSLPTLFPGVILPSDVETGPTRPTPASKLPLVRLMEQGNAPLTTSLPPLTVQVPNPVLVPFNVNVPVPFFTSGKKPAPPRIPSKVVLVLSLPVVSVPTPIETVPLPDNEPIVSLWLFKSSQPEPWIVTAEESAI